MAGKQESGEKGKREEAMTWSGGNRDPGNGQRHDGVSEAINGASEKGEQGA